MYDMLQRLHTACILHRCRFLRAELARHSVLDDENSLLSERALTPDLGRQQKFELAYRTPELSGQAAATTTLSATKVQR